MSADTTIQLSPYQARLLSRKMGTPVNPLMKRRYIEWHREIDSLHDLLALALHRKVMAVEEVGLLRQVLSGFRTVASECEDLERAEWENSQHKGGNNGCK